MGVSLSHNSAAFKKASSLLNNSKVLKTNSFYKYNPQTGYFGESTSKTRETTRTIFTDGNPNEEARKMFKQLSKGSEVTTIKENHIWLAILDDGTKISLRIDFPTGHLPAVQLIKDKSDTSQIKSQKIHFSNKRSRK